MNGTACGANSPSASNTSPITPSPPANQASPTMPVITAAEASTMPTWNAADDNLVVMIFRHGQIALFLGLLGLFGKLLAAGFRF